MKCSLIFSFLFFNSRSCLLDMCECPNRQCFCESFTAYAHECQRLGVPLPDWRKATGCHALHWKNQANWVCNTFHYTIIFLANTSQRLILITILCKFNTLLGFSIMLKQISATACTPTWAIVCFHCMSLWKLFTNWYFLILSNVQHLLAEQH